jgi:hypothetical protein
MIVLGPKLVEKGTGLDVVASWEKMSKSKYNGVDPETMLKDYGVDTTRLLILADVAPTSNRHWTSDSKSLSHTGTYEPRNYVPYRSLFLPQDYKIVIREIDCANCYFIFFGYYY